MGITATQTQGKGVLNTACGRYLTDATAAAIVITCGFKPRYVKVINNTSSDQMEYFEGMAAASARKQIAAGTGSAITSNGITVADKGFTIGLDADVNVINEQLSWIAIG